MGITGRKKTLHWPEMWSKSGLHEDRPKINWETRDAVPTKKYVKSISRDWHFPNFRFLSYLWERTASKSRSTWRHISPENPSVLTTGGTIKAWPTLSDAVASRQVLHAHGMKPLITCKCVPYALIQELNILLAVQHQRKPLHDIETGIVLMLFLQS